MSDWTGRIVRDSLVDFSVLDHVNVLGERSRELGVSGRWTVLDVQVDPEDLEEVIKILSSKALARAWFAVFERDDRQVIVFRGKSFNIRKGSERSLTEVKNWAFKKYNIMPEVFDTNF